MSIRQKQISKVIGLLVVSFILMATGVVYLVNYAVTKENESSVKNSRLFCNKDIEVTLTSESIWKIKCRDAICVAVDGNNTKVIFDVCN